MNTTLGSSRQWLRQIEEKIGNRRLIWFGTRGSDAQSLLRFPQFRWCYSLIAPLGALSMATDVCLEAIRGERVDLNNYSTDLDTSASAKRLHRELVQAFDEPAVLITYRPAAFLTSAYFPRSDRVRYLGTFHERQAAFEHKSWVETELQRAGIRVIPWTYFGDDDRALLAEYVTAHGRTVVRANRSSGGVGFMLADHPQEVLEHLPFHGDGFVAASPFLVPNIPLNVGACVFEDGRVTLHAPSLQLIGINACTERPFGYCGNDFARIRELPLKVLDEFERMTRQAGKWLRGQGYLGAFGVDAIMHGGHLYLMEINPRFQGSSGVGAELSRALDLPDLFADHVAALLGLQSPTYTRIRLRDLARQQPERAHIICYNRTRARLVRRDVVPPDGQSTNPLYLPEPGMAVAPEGMLFKLVLERSVTSDGQSIEPALTLEIEQLTARLFEPDAVSLPRPAPPQGD